MLRQLQPRKIFNLWKVRMCTIAWASQKLFQPHTTIIALESHRLRKGRGIGVSNNERCIVVWNFKIMGDVDERNAWVSISQAIF